MDITLREWLFLLLGSVLTCGYLSILGAWIQRRAYENTRRDQEDDRTTPGFGN